MNVAIVGSPNYPDLEQVEKFVIALARKYSQAKVISGGDPGVQHEAEQAARSMLLHTKSYRPKKDFRHYKILLVETSRFVLSIRDDDGRTLHFKTLRETEFYRNGLIVRDAQQIVAFQYQQHNSTQDLIDKARVLGKPVTIYTPRLEVV